MRILLVVTLLFLTSFTSAQQNPVLVDEFPRVTCEDFLARSDNFVHLLNQNPTAAGFVVLSRNSWYFSKLLQTTLNVGLKQANRVTVVEIDNHELGNKFWMIPVGTEEPNIAGGRIVASHPRSYSGLTLFSHEGESPCSSNTAPAFAAVLKADSNLVGRVIIHGTQKDCAEAIDWVLQRLMIDNGVPRSRFRIYYKTTEVPFTEFWLIPKPQK